MVVKKVNGKWFLRRRGKWLNLSMWANTHGDGLKGRVILATGIVKCMLGVHRYTHFCGFTHDSKGKIDGFRSYRACSYCHREHR